MLEKALDSLSGRKKETGLPAYKAAGPGMEKGGSGRWIPSASYCTTGQFMNLRGGYTRHCGPTAAVNVIRTLMRMKADDLLGKQRSGKQNSKGDPSGMKAGDPGPSAAKTNAGGAYAPDQLFLLCADIGKQMHIYWNTEILGRFGGTSNFLTPMYLRRCLRAVGLGDRAEVCFHPWISPDAVEKALDQGKIVYLQVYGHPRYKNHHMLCYGSRFLEKDTGPARQFLLADGWSPFPLWVEEKDLGRGHFLTIRA